MPRRTLCKEDIANYVNSEFETLKAFLSELHLKNCELALSLLEDVFEDELDRRYGENPKHSISIPKIS